MELIEWTKSSRGFDEFEELLFCPYFNFEPDDPSYELQIASNLTIKPKDFFMHAKLRDGCTAATVEQNLAGSLQTPPSKATQVRAKTPSLGAPAGLTVLL